MDLATGAMECLLQKLAELLKQEYRMQAGVRGDVEFLKRELASMHLALQKFGDLPRDQLDKQTKHWAGEVRELSYQIEDVVDSFLVRVDDGREVEKNSHKLKQLKEKVVSLFKKGRSRRQIAEAIKEIKDRVQEVADRRDRYGIDGVVAKAAATTAVDPRLRALYTKGTEIIGINAKRRQLMNLLRVDLDEKEEATKRLKIISVVGFGGLGKTTLVKTVFDDMKADFDCRAFVPVGRNADLKKVLMDILIDLGKTDSHLTMLDERQLIDNILVFLSKKRYLIVIDDIWDENLWKSLKCAFPNGSNLGNRLITTTRILSVSKTCCSSSDDSIYQMKPLTSEDSQRLFYGRIFQSETNCPPELQKVSMDILRKCGGVPLAIITIAGLLASDQRRRSKGEWHALLKSIGRGFTEDASVEEMQRILSFSYYDLPSHLKTCLLYLSAYPEDSEINKHQLIWKWIAEGFVQSKKQETSLFELGENYFNELINRSMIEPVYDDEYGVKACRVHDMVLDLICILSIEENFVTIYDGIQDCRSSPCIRRLSIQDRNKNNQSTPVVCMNMSQVRSVTLSNLSSCLMPPLSSFKVLRVLDLGECDLEKYSHLNLGGVENLVHLRYLGLARTNICELPAEIGKLQFLLVLDLRGNSNLKELPSSVLKLRRLVALYIEGCFMRLPDGFGCLTSIEVLDGIIASLNNLKELPQLAKLRNLSISIRDKSYELQEAFVECLCNLQPNIQSLVIDCSGPIYLLWERWVPPQHLRIFHMSGYLSALPTWIKRNHSDLSNLSRLCIWVMGLQQEDLCILGRLPCLHYLKLRSIYLTQKLRLMGIHGFQSIIFFSLYSSSPGQIVFEEGALPKVEVIHLNSSSSMAKDDGSGGGGFYVYNDGNGGVSFYVNGDDSDGAFFCDVNGDGNGGFDLGLGNLLSLRHAIVTLHGKGAYNARNALWKAAHIHPNHPRLTIDIC